ncbi:regulation of nuclear pre-mRNA domain-containing protein 1B [Cocos nucifera]|nr:regulation of nuclear pre-mRNA domain-containing protein 1B [Cocos nucifera]
MVGLTEVDIWEERKVFGSRGQILKVELLGRNLESRNRNGKGISYKLKPPSAELLEKLISGYGHVYDMDEDALFGKCQTAISFVEKVQKDFNSGNISESATMADLHVQHGILKECIEQLKAAESSRATLLSHLREALHDQELKIEKVHNELKAMQPRYEQADNIYQQLLGCNIRESPPEQTPKESPSPFFDAPPGFVPKSGDGDGDKAPSTPVKYDQEGPLANDDSSHTEEEHRKTAAASVAAKLAASTSSAQMLSYVLSSLASEGVISQTVKECPSDNKRPKLDNDVPSYMPPPQSQSQSQTQPPPPPFPHPDMLHQPPPPPPPPPPSPLPSMSQPSPSVQLLAPPPPPTTIQLMQAAAGPVTAVPFSYGSAPLPLPSYPMVGMPPYSSVPNPYHGFQASDAVGGLFSQPPLPTAPPPMTRQ